jgi:hypothetical protein
MANPMEPSPPWEAASRSAPQEFPNILWNPKVHHVHKSPPLVPTLNHIHPVHTTTSYFSKIHFIIILASTARSSYWSASFCLSHQNLACIPFLSMLATYTANHILIDLIILIIFEEEYKFWSSSLCSFLQPSVTSSLFGPNILFSTLFSNILSLCSSLNVRDQVSHPYRTTDKRTVLCILIFTAHLFICLYFVCSVHLGAVVLNVAQMQLRPSLPASSYPWKSALVTIRIFPFHVGICGETCGLEGV